MSSRPKTQKSAQISVRNFPVVFADVTFPKSQKKELNNIASKITRSPYI